MRLNGEFDNIKIHFINDEVLTIDQDDIIDFYCSGLNSILSTFSNFDTYEASYIFFILKEKADIFINTGKLKGTLFSVLKSTVIKWIEVYTSKERYKIIPYIEMVNVENLTFSDARFITKDNEWNVAQTYGEVNEGDLAVIIDKEVADEAFEA